MAKALWKGYITLGPLAIPIRLHATTQASKPRFVLVHESDKSPVERVLTCQAEGRPIAYSETIRAAVTDNQALIPLTKEELSYATPDAHNFVIVQFCDVATIQPIYYETAYYATAGKGGEYAYALLKEVCVNKQVAAVGSLSIRGRQHIGALAGLDDRLVMYRLRFTEEIIRPDTIPTSELPVPSSEDLALFGAVANHMQRPFHARDFHDSYSEQLSRIITLKQRELHVPYVQPEHVRATSSKDMHHTLEAVLGSFRQNTLEP